MTTKITEEMTIPEILKNFPQTKDVFEKYGIDPTYKALEFENISASVRVNQINLQNILAELNQVV